MRSTSRWLVLVAGLLLAACGGGGGGQEQATSSGGDSGSGSTSGGGAGSGGGSAGSGGSGAPAGSAATCGSVDVPPELLAGNAEGLWRGYAMVVDPLMGGDTVGVVGLVARSGEARFWLTSDLGSVRGGGAFVGPVGQTTDGVLLSKLRGFARPFGGTAATRYMMAMSLTTAEPSASLHGGFMVARPSVIGRPRCAALNLAYDAAYDQPVPLADSAGVYTTSDQIGYTMTVAVDPSGALNGSDTNGCVFNGALSVPDAAHNYYAAAVDVTGCAATSGHFDGVTVPVRGADGRVSVLYLSVSRSDLVISFALGH